ncbi:hypothetical protein [Magnetococcus sp. PR-3]|uniref:hypothetical protein n=1 Tax=Magnetococcus sp. PR-3 TaxID=3120355 RepID=UPI002FCDE640
MSGKKTPTSDHQAHIPGRPTVGVECHFPDCAERHNCRHVYVEEFLHADGTCPYYRPKSHLKLVKRPHRPQHR